MIKIKRASLDDIDAIMPVIKNAQEYLAAQNIDQWQNDFPNRGVVENDIKTAEAYILDDNGRVAGYFVLYAPPEPVYDDLDGGSWLYSGENYGAMHRVAISGDYRGQGLAHMIYDKCEARSRELGYASLRVDTHPENKIMRHMAESHGFGECGYVYYYGNMQRIAFEKLLK
ncbi:MAG: GNAT family N-acetyltransferase [Clostridia bacterium]|nr:GNAT family N-acetyltransferase [Clostridia bacterium]